MAPAAYSNMSGVYIGQPDGINNNRIKATLFDVYPLKEGFRAATMMAPVFDAAGNQIGAVTIAFKPSAVINASVTPILAGTPYSMWAMQKNSLEIYDPDPAQEGLIIFQDSMFQKYSASFALVHQIADTPSGQGSYQFPKTLDSSEMLTKECMWTTIGGYGTEWRLIIVHAI
jgi:Na+/glutamate symporter